MDYIRASEKRQMPTMIYGTAWKKEETSNLVYQALKEGFRGLDTAGQPRHYNEKLVGVGIQKAVDRKILKREDLYIQTKFTPLVGQNKNNMPYLESDDLKTQVIKSFENSKKNLKTNYIDSYLLHSPVFPLKKLFELWQIMQEFYYEKQTGRLGICNCYDLDMLKYLFKYAEVKPIIIQNRFYAQSGYDKEIRSWCRDMGITYQSFWSLTANPGIVNSPVIEELSKKYNKTNEQIFYKFLNEIDIVPLNGTTSLEHMKLDLNLDDFNLEEGEVITINTLL